MARQWEAEQTIEPALALQLIQKQFPELGATKIKLLGTGWDNSAFLVDESLIFRFPRREIALPLLETEWCILPKLAPLIPLPIPVPRWKGSPALGFPWPFIGYRMLPGVTACYANLSEKERAQLAEPLGRFLATLHAMPLSIMDGCPITEDNKERIDGSALTKKIIANFQELSGLGLLKNEKQLLAVLCHSQNFRAPVSSHLVQGDFYVRHILVDDKRHLAGVIDWGDVHIGDPAIDLASAHSFLPIEAHSQFRKAYGDISPETWTLAKLRALYGSSLLCLFGNHSGDKTLVREGARALNVMQDSLKEY